MKTFLVKHLFRMNLAMIMAGMFGFLAVACEDYDEFYEESDLVGQPAELTNGQQVTPSTYDNRVWLWVHDYYGRLNKCSGTVMSEKWVLTTRSCLKPNRNGDPYTNINRNSPYGAFVTRGNQDAWNAVIPIWYWKLSGHTDAAMVRLSTPIDMGQAGYSTQISNWEMEALRDTDNSIYCNSYSALTPGVEDRSTLVDDFFNPYVLKRESISIMHRGGIDSSDDALVTGMNGITPADSGGGCFLDVNGGAVFIGMIAGEEYQERYNRFLVSNSILESYVSSITGLQH